MPAAADGSMRRDILSAYAASASRILSWVIVSALVYRRSAEAFAMLALVRGTLGILNYCSLGLLPAMIQAFASIPSPPGTPGGEGQGKGGSYPMETSTGPSLTRSPIPVETSPAPLAYVTPETTRKDIVRSGQRLQPDPATIDILGAGTTIAAFTTTLTLFAAIVCGVHAERIFRIPTSTATRHVGFLIGTLGAGFAFRWSSDPVSALLQARRRIPLDNWITVFTEGAWAILTWLLMRDRADVLEATGLAYALSGLIAPSARIAVAHLAEGVSVTTRFFFASGTLAALLSNGLLITLAQLADYLYAPTDYILINRLLTARDLANYAPALQIDAGLMILVGGLASVLLPKAALAHGAGDRAAVRAYYLRGTLASATLLAGASIIVYLLSPWIFRLWLGDPMPGTRAILPLVLFHNTLGGSALIGRSILLAIGRTKPFTIAVLIAGVTNVVASYAFVHYFGWGLKGIVLGTIVAVVARCGVWMPWYVLRHVGEAHADVSPAVD